MLGLALSAYDLWKRLSPKQRKALDQLRKNGPAVAKHASRGARAAAKRVKR